MFYTATVMPYNITFMDDLSEGWQYIDLVVDILFWIDLAINFISAYYDEG